MRLFFSVWLACCCVMVCIGPSGVRCELNVHRMMSAPLYGCYALAFTKKIYCSVDFVIRLCTFVKSKFNQKNIFMENQENNHGQLQIELKEEIAQGVYSNLAVIAHSSSEFVVDFVRVLPGMPKANVQSRIVLAPEHAKRLLRALQDNVDKYERVFGPIRMPEEMVYPTIPGVQGEA